MQSIAANVVREHFQRTSDQPHFFDDLVDTDKLERRISPAVTEAKAVFYSTFDALRARCPADVLPLLLNLEVAVSNWTTASSDMAWSLGRAVGAQLHKAMPEVKTRREPLDRV